MDTITPGTIWTIVLSLASAVVLLSNAAEKVVKAIQAAKAPNAKQDERLRKVEEHMEEIDRYLEKDSKHFDAIDEGSRVTQLALLALLDHGIDGNNVKQMQTAKEELQNYLINR